MFQSAKLAGSLARASRNITGAQGWDCVVQSTDDIIYPLRRCDRLDQKWCRENIKVPSILLCDSADGDEEVSTLGPNVKSIVLSHTLPHLSYLARRARQFKVPLITVEDVSLVEQIQTYDGQNVFIRAKPGDVKIKVTSADASPNTSLSTRMDYTRIASPISVSDTSYAKDPLPLVSLAKNIDFTVSVAC